MARDNNAGADEPSTSGGTTIRTYMTVAAALAVAFILGGLLLTMIS